MCFILQILPLYNSIIQFKFYMFWIEKAQFNSERSMIPVHLPDSSNSHSSSSLRTGSYGQEGAKLKTDVYPCLLCTADPRVLSRIPRNFVLVGGQEFASDSVLLPSMCT